MLAMLTENPDTVLMLLTRLYPEGILETGCDGRNNALHLLGEQSCPDSGEDSHMTMARYLIEHNSSILHTIDIEYETPPQRLGLYSECVDTLSVLYDASARFDISGLSYGLSELYVGVARSVEIVNFSKEVSVEYVGIEDVLEW